jgi:hypothetical protein
MSEKNQTRKGYTEWDSIYRKYELIYNDKVFE